MIIFKMLQIGNFRYFFLSEIIYAFGVGMSTVGANWYLMDQTNSTTAVGVMLALNVIAGFIISPVIGTLTDRLNRKTIIIWTYLIQALLILGIAGLFIFDEFKIGYLYLFSIVNGMGWTTYMSTSRSLLQEILSEKDIINGNSLIEISLQVGMFTAGGISGIFYQIAGFEFILIANSIAFILSCWLISRVKHHSVIKNNDDEPYLASFNNGINYLLRRLNVFFIGIVAIIPLVATMMYNVVLPEYVKESLDGSSIEFGISDMFYGIGGVLSGFLAVLFAKRFSRYSSITILFIVSISFLIVLALNTYITLLFLGSLIFGLCNSSLRILMNTTIMEIVPKSYMGRAMSVWMAISLLLQSVISPGLGALIDSFSPALGFLVLSGIMLIGLMIHLILIYLKSKRNKTKHSLENTINNTI